MNYKIVQKTSYVHNVKRWDTITNTFILKSYLKGLGANIPLHTDQDLYNIPDPNQVVGAPKTFRVAITSATECSVLVFFLKFELHQ